MAGDLNSIFGDLGGAVSDFFSSQGDAISAQSYAQAAKLSGQSIQQEKEATAIKQAQAQRASYLGIGATTADVGNAGFANSGSALNLIRMSAQQGTLQKAVVGVQGAIEENSLKVQQQAEEAQAQSAEAASQGGLFGGFLNLIGGAAGIAMML